MTADALAPFAVKLPAAIDSIEQQDSCAPWKKVSQTCAKIITTTL